MSMMPNIPSDYLLGAGDGLPSPCNQHWDTPLLGRALLIGRPCLVYECLREAMNLRGIETHVGPFEKPFSLSVSEYEYDVLVIFMMRCESGEKQMIAGLRSQIPHAPAVALVEDADAEAASFCGKGFSTLLSMWCSSYSSAPGTLTEAIGPTPICNPILPIRKLLTAGQAPARPMFASPRAS